MKKCEYTEKHFPSYDERQEEINEAKQEDRDLPVFSREVPASSSRTETEDGISVVYAWKGSKSPNIKVKQMLFKKSERLGDLYRIDRKDGTDRLAVRKNGKTYILRRTTAEIAKALYRIAEKIKDCSECVVGYLKSLMGRFYVISVVEGEAWSFDNGIISDNINYVDLADMDDSHKKKLIELVIEKLSSLHAQNLVLGKFSLDNLLIFNHDVKFTDLRNMRASRKKSFVVEEFKRAMSYLLSAGIAEKEDVAVAAAYYSAENSESCNEWYCENFNEEPEDDFAIASKIEEDILA